jgi:RNA polymerase sigma-70 factor (ECF subfamily)
MKTSSKGAGTFHIWQIETDLVPDFKPFPVGLDSMIEGALRDPYFGRRRLDESSAIMRLKQGDISGLEFLVHRYQVKALRVAYLITQDRELAQDIVQTTFLRVCRRIDQFDATRPFAPWFLRIVANDAVKAMTRRRRHLSLDAETVTGQTLAEMLPNPAPGPVSAAEAAELREEVWQALEALSPEQRAAIVLRYYLDFSEQELAAELDIPRGTVKWRLFAARKQLRTLLHMFAGNTTRRQEGEA